MEDRPLATLVLAEHDNQSLAVGTLCAIKAAFEIKDDDKSLPVSVLLIGYQCQSVLDELNCVQGVAEIIWVDAKGYEHGLAENIAPLISQVAKNYSHILSPASTFGKNVMPRVAALLNVGQLSDVMTIESIDTVIRPIYAGNALARVTSNDPYKVMTIRSTAFDAAELSDTPVVPKLTQVDTVIINKLSEFVSQQTPESERPELPAARVVVSGGRAFGSKEKFVLVEQLADK